MLQAIGLLYLRDLAGDCPHPVVAAICQKYSGFWAALLVLVLGRWPDTFQKYLPAHSRGRLVALFHGARRERDIDRLCIQLPPQMESAKNPALMLRKRRTVPCSFSPRIPRCPKVPVGWMKQKREDDTEGTPQPSVSSAH